MEAGRTKKRKRLIIIASILLILFVCACAVAKIGYDICFQRADMDEHSMLLRRADVSGYPRVPISFMSGNNKLQGYIYGEGHEKGLVVISHGLGAGSVSYFTETRYFVDNGWCVFVFDNTGSHESEGKNTRGISQSLLDLRAALNYIDQDENLNALPLVLYGHSWGGYAVTAILNERDNVRAAVSIAGFSTPGKAMYDFAENRTGIWGVMAFPLFWGYHNILFGGNANISALDGINRTGIPVMIIHGVQDNVLRYDVSGIISHQAQITNPNVVYILREANGSSGHADLLDEELLNAINSFYNNVIAQWTIGG